MFTKALCTIAKAWKQSNYPLQDKWIKTMWNIIQSLKKGKGIDDKRGEHERATVSWKMTQK